MNKKIFGRLPFLIVVMLSVMLTGAFAAPLAWFPGPSISPLSGAAAVVDPGLGNILIGGDSGYPYPEYLTATNQYWGVVPMPLYSVNIAPGAVASGGMIILYGGTDGTSSQSAVIGYSTSDPATSLASMSVARSYLGYAADASGTPYAIGGLDGNGNPLASAERYNQDADAWTAIAPMPVARYNFPAVFDHTNRIYIFGGYNDTVSGNETATVYRYSTKSNNWTAVASMPTATAGSAAAFGKDGKIYVVGGLSGGVATDAVQVYDPSANSWTISTPLPEALSGSAMGVDSLGRLIVMGGADINGNDVGDVWRSQPFGVADSAPAFTQFPATNAVYNQPYASTINASGNPPPTYQLLSGPSTMSVDYYSGAITWMPEDADIGTNTVTVQASNYSGSTNYTFSIKVPNPPPGVLSNLTVVSVTDNSVTLSWTPESPLVGPTTYSAWLRHSIHDPKGSGGTVWYTQIGGTTTQPPLTITGLTPGASQAYYIVATASGGSSGYTSAIGATTTAPQGPTNLVVTSVTPTTVGLAWSPSPGPADNPLYSAITSYTITERIASPPANIPTVTNITGTSGTVTGLKPGSSHIWYVAGVDAAGNASPLTFIYVVVSNPLPPHLNVAPATGSGGFQFSASQPGATNQPVTIQATTNPADPNSWVPIASFTPASNPFTFTDTNSAQYPNRFYRVVTQ